MKILVTGGAGFIGSHIVDRLLDEGNEVTVMDLWESSEMRANSGNSRFNFVKGNVLDDELLEANINEKDIVIHMAAVLGTSETITTYDVEQVALTNVVGTVKVLKNCKKAGVGRVIVPTTPDVTWLNPYKITKAAIEKFCQLFHEEYGLDAVCLKLGNIYGSRERWLDGPKEAPYNYQKIVPTILMETMKGNPFRVFGSGEQKSEYIYVEDVVESFHRACDIENYPDLGGKVIHIGRGSNFSVLDIVEATEKAWGRKIELEFVEMRPGEHHVEIALDPEPLKEFLDYELQWGLERGMGPTIEYYEQQYERNY
mgnify:CR=1 FL=1